MNEYDSDKISDLMQSVNFVRSETLTDVDCIIFNTCHIREKDVLYLILATLEKKQLRKFTLILVKLKS